MDKPTMTVTPSKKTSKAPEPKWTFDDYMLLGDDKQYEIHEGGLIMAPAPSVEHQGITFKLARLLHDHVARIRLGEIIISPCDVILSDTDIFQPDILFIKKGNYDTIKEGKIFGPPDLVIEVLSPSTADIDMNRKRMLYGKYGVPEYWIVSPEMKTVMLFTNEDGKMKLLKEFCDDEKIESNILGEMDFPISEIFISPWE